MSVMAMQPKLTQLYDLIDKVSNYPLSTGHLIKLAKDVGAPKEVINFYKSFGQNQIFENEEDLTRRSEQVDMLRQESKDMPDEIQVATEEY